MGQGDKALRWRRKRCLSCRALFDPDPRTKDHQRYCSKAECQTVRQRKNKKDWYWRNPDCVADQKRKWQQKHPGYSQQRRIADPAMTVEINRGQRPIMGTKNGGP